MDTAQWPQGIGVVKPMEGSKPMLERRARPQKDQALNCPRCNSTNTKFCYYNNYSLSQPRYFCKTCRRYWTEGGSLRNVPVGGGSRKNKRPISSSSSSSSSALSKKFPELTPLVFPQSSYQNPKINLERQDLNLSYPSTTEDYSTTAKFVEVSYRTETKSHHHHQNPSSSSAMELLKTGMTTSRGLSSFMSFPVSADHSSSAIYSTGFPLQEFKPTLNFSLLEGFENGYGSSIQGVHEPGARLLFPMEDMKQVPSSTTDQFEQNKGQGQGHTTGYWNGVLGEGSW